MTDAIAPIATGQTPLAPEKAPTDSRDDEMRKNAKAFEAVFIAQMLSQTGLAKAFSANSGFGGEAFSSLLVEQYANRLVDQGGFGLAENIYEQMRGKEASNVDRTVS